MTIDVDEQLGALVVAHPSYAPILEGYRLDFCCQGAQSLAEACRRKGVDLDRVVAELEALGGRGSERTWLDAPLGELVEHIQRKYHEPLRRELPGLDEKARRVARVHGAGRPELHEVEALVSALTSDLLHHTDKEDQVLFPWIRGMEQGESRGANLSAPIKVMEADHEKAGALLERLRAATRDYLLPEEACTTYRLLFSGLEQFERDLHVHIHLENSILFPRALALSETTG